MPKVQIQIRMSEGGFLKGDFDASSTLYDIKTFVLQNWQGGDAHLTRFSFSCPYPRRTFSPNEMSQTLEELQLTDRPTLLITPEANSRSTSIQPLPPWNSLAGINPLVMISRILKLIWLWLELARAKLMAFISGESTDSAHSQRAPSRSHLSSSSSEKAPKALSDGKNKSEAFVRAREGSNVFVMGPREEDNAKKSGDSHSLWNGNSLQFDGKDDDKRQ